MADVHDAIELNKAAGANLPTWSSIPTADLDALHQQLADAQARIESLERERDAVIRTWKEAIEVERQDAADREANLRAVLADFCVQVELYATWPRGKDSEAAWARLCDLAQAYKAGDAPDVAGLLRTAVGLLELSWGAFGVPDIAVLADDVAEFLDLPAIKALRKE